ncbi:hypothetical protein BDR04DRAFT_1100040, partial [Suillus decipiens]
FRSNLNVTLEPFDALETAHSRGYIPFLFHYLTYYRRLSIWSQFLLVTTKLVICVYFQSLAIVTDTPFSIHRCQLYDSTLAIPLTLLIQSLYPLYFPFLSIQV